MLPCWFMISPQLSFRSPSERSNAGFFLHSYITMISLDFKNKLVLVTGGGRGIGLEITRAIAEGENQQRSDPYSSEPDTTCPFLFQLARILQSHTRQRTAQS
jgi:hypothetical protein